MNNKFYIGVGILILLLFSSLFVGFFAQKRQDPIKETVSAAQEAAKNENIRESVRLIQQAQRSWKRNWKSIASFSHHATMEEIDRLFAQLSVCDNLESKQDFLTASAELCSLLDALTNDQAFTWWNLL